MNLYPAIRNPAKRTARPVHALRPMALVLSGLLIGGFWAGCSGGGGGDSEGDSGGGNQLNGSRTASTGIRLIHGGLDEAPVTLSVDGSKVVQAGFGEETRFSKVAPGDHLVRVSREDNALFEQSVTFEKDTEYSVLLVGEARRDSQQVRVIHEPILRPGAGESAVTVVNLLGGRDGLKVECANQQSDAVTLGEQSERILIPSGSQLCRVLDDNGTVLGEAPYLLADRGELALAVVGSTSLGVRFVKSFQDLD